MKEDQHHKGPSYLSLKVPGTQHHHVLVVHVWGANLWEILSSLALGISPPPLPLFSKTSPDFGRGKFYLDSLGGPSV